MGSEIALRVDVDELQRLGEMMSASGFFKDSRSAAQAAVKVQAGRELGVPPVAAMKGIHIVEGKIELSGTLIASLIKRSGRYDYRVTEHTDKRCTVAFYGPDLATGDIEKLGESTWTMDDAKRAGLGARDNWRKYPRAMLFNRAIAEGARVFVPDVFDGQVYAEGEIPRPDGEPEPEDAEIVDGEVVEEPAGGSQESGAASEATESADLEPPVVTITKAQRTKLMAIAKGRGLDDDARKAQASLVLGREITSFNDITKAEASDLIEVWATEGGAGEVSPSGEGATEDSAPSEDSGSGDTSATGGAGHPADEKELGTPPPDPVSSDPIERLGELAKQVGMNTPKLLVFTRKTLDEDIKKLSERGQPIGSALTDEQLAKVIAALENVAAQGALS